MNKFIPENDKCIFTGSTLILPAISIGNVPQLAIDLLITTLSLQRIGFLEDENVLPIAGASEHTAGNGITVAIEGKKKKRNAFIENLLAFIKESNFSKVILLSSADATYRIDDQLIGIPLRFLATSEIPNDLLEKSNTLGLKLMEKIPKNEYETSIQDYHKKQDDDQGLPQIPGGGISKYLFHNTRDAFLLSDYTNSLLNLSSHKDTIKWKAPSSWTSLFGKPFEQELYE
ncbi:5537_t:CDS:2 [Diversispora eburnea]|uniref:Proteasome assembly chaperone 2 n=1 Tax=Diversispora eburnea TaxID=1213867 RepID=A0A9N8V0K3_9GLOM|nr:5537_t:CDS:2 [Diversispora eburnea]